MKKLLIWIIGIYVKLLVKKPQPYTYTKYTFFSDVNDHLLGTINFLKSRKIDEIVFIDIGVADGATSLLFAKSFAKIKIYGFEPIPDAYEKAKKKLLPYPNVLLKNAAISNAIGSTSFYVTNNSDSSSLYKPTSIGYENIHLEKVIEVKTTTLDNETESLTDITLLKLDTQGTELVILQNGIKTLQKTKYVLLEMSVTKQYENACLYYELDDFLRKQGFRLIGMFHRFVGMVEYDALYEKI